MAPPTGNFLRCRILALFLKSTLSFKYLILITVKCHFAGFIIDRKGRIIAGDIYKGWTLGISAIVPNHIHGRIFGILKVQLALFSILPLLILFMFRFDRVRILHVTG